VTHFARCVDGERRASSRLVGRLPCVASARDARARGAGARRRSPAAVARVVRDLDDPPVRAFVPAPRPCVAPLRAFVAPPRGFVALPRARDRVPCDRDVRFM
jgi:hypothetical protein